MYQTIAGQRFEKPEPWKSDMLNVLGDLVYQKSKGATVQNEIDVVIENWVACESLPVLSVKCKQIGVKRNV